MNLQRAFQATNSSYGAVAWPYTQNNSTTYNCYGYAAIFGYAINPEYSAHTSGGIYLVNVNQVAQYALANLK